MDFEDKNAAIVSLLTQHQSALLLYVESLMPGDASSAKDVAQETNRIVWEKREEFELGTNFKAWIFSVARFQVRKFRFRQARDSRLVFCEELEDTMTEELSEQLDDLTEHQVALKGCLEQLKPADRQLIHHRYYKDGSLQAYSDEIGRSVGGLKVTLHRLRGRLQQCVERKMAMLQHKGGLA